MTKFKEFLNETTEKILLTEAGLSRIVQKIKLEQNDFAVITAYRDVHDKEENIKRNRKLRAEFNQRKMGVYQLVGHWQECQIEDVPYKDCPKDQLKDVVERSYMIIRPDEMTQNEFKKLIQNLTKKFDQDGSVISLNGNIQIIEKDGNMFKIGDKVTLNKIAQAYSQHVKKLQVPFVFEGCEIPGNNHGRMLFDLNGLSYPRVEKDEIFELIVI